MTRTRRGIVIGVAVLSLAIAGCGSEDDEDSAGGTTETTETAETTTDTSEASTGTKLVGSVASDDFTITLTTEDGADVSSLPAGGYTLQIVDKTDIHNFHLTGAGVDVSSEVSGQVDEENDVTLEAGTYTFVCDPHATSMTGSFEVSG
jgi:plastocyanin